MKIGFIGFSGSGKTTLALEAGKRGYRSVDTDTMFCEMHGLSPDELILSGRESDFRMLEMKTVKKAIDGDIRIIAFGGGIHFGNPVYREIAGSDTKLIFLRGSFKNLLDRASGRPMFEMLGEDGYRKLFEERQELYMRASDFVVDVDGKSITELFVEVENIWNLLFQRNLKQS